MKHSKMIKAMVILILTLSFSFCLVACSEPDTEKKGVTILPDSTVATVNYAVTFDSNGGTAVSAINTTVNSIISKPSNPTKTGYNFIGWFTNSALFTQWDFTKDIVTSNITLYAGWQLSEKVFINDRAFSFTDGVCNYVLSAETDTVSLTNKIVLENTNYRYRFYADEECKNAVGEIDSADFSVVPGENIYFLKIMNSSLEYVDTVKFVIKRNCLFTVSFYDVNGVLLGKKQCEEGLSLDSAVEYPLIGYDVMWKNGEEVWGFGVGGSEIYNNLNLYAVATVKKYMVALDANGGTTSVCEVKIPFGEQFKFPVPSKQGAGFIGWFTSEGAKITENNGMSLSGWNIPYDTALTARYDANAEDVIVIRTLSGNEVGQTQTLIANGDSAHLKTNELYAGIDKEGLDYIIYAFEGWYNGNTLLSKEREYTSNPIADRTVFVEKWHKLTLHAKDEAGNPISQILNIDGNQNLEKFGNINLGEVLTITAVSAGEGKHLFREWNGNWTITDFISNNSIGIRINGTAEASSTWALVNVFPKIKLDDVITEDEEIMNSITGIKGLQPLQDIILEVSPLADKTFAGWYLGTGENEECIGNDFVLESDFIFDGTELPPEYTAKWLTTANVFIVNSEDETKGTVGVRINRADNRIGGTLTLVPEVQTGYVLEGLYQGDTRVGNINSRNLVRTISSTNQIYQARFIKNEISVLANKYDAGAVYYKVNNSKKILGSSYGGNLEFIGMVYDDEIILSSETYDGYVWLGWYNCTEDGKLEFSSSNKELIVQTPSDFAYKKQLVACWKPTKYNVNITAGVFSEASISYVSEGKYYLYEAGNYVLAPEGVASEYTNYYICAEDTFTGGNQKAISKISYTYPGEDITLIADINEGYRFEGWYDENGNLITFDREYTFNVVSLSDKYIAYYTYLTEEYEVNVSVYEGTDETPSAIGAGSVSYYAYKEYTTDKNNYPDGFIEYCEILTKTKKEAVGLTAENESDCKGYNYLGLFNSIDPNPNWDALRNPISDEMFFDANLFGYRYKINVTNIKRTGGDRQNYLAVWSRGNSSIYYITSDIFNADNSKGSVYYMAYNGQIVLVAEPKIGSVFKGWTNIDGGIVSTELVYETNNNGRGKTYTAGWKALNNTEYEMEINIVGKANSEEGGFFIHGIEAIQTEKNVKSDNIILEAYTNDGYSFTGWYMDGKILTTAEVFEIVRRQEIFEEEKDGGIIANSVETLTLYEKGISICEITNGVIEPRWKKSDAEILIETIGDATITGFYAEDENGEQKSYYKIKINSDIEYENGEAWRKGWFFDGWYDNNGNKISDKSEFIVLAGDVKTYYKAIWSKINVNISIQSNGTEMGGSTATYGTYLSGSNLTLMLNAVPASGYVFTGWNLVDNGELKLQSYNLQYTMNLGAFNRTNSYNFVYNALFTRIATQNNPTARNAETGVDLPAPYLFGIKTSGGEDYYTITASPIHGYAFLGWQEKNIVSYDYISTDRVFHYSLNDYSALTAVYIPITSCDGYEDFVFVVDKKNSNNVTYHAYTCTIDNSKELVFEVILNVNDGFAYSIIAGEGNIINAEKESPFKVIVREADFIGNKRITVIFNRISILNNSYTTLEQQIDNTIFNYTGKYVYADGKIVNRGFYQEKWILNSDFGEQDYSFIGWYNEEGELLDIYNNYEINALKTNKSLTSKYGKYEIIIHNTDEKAGNIFVDGYDVTVSFEINTKEKIIIDTFPKGVASQVLNAWSQVTYPTDYVYKQVPGYMFGGWYDNADCEGKPYDFDAKIKKDIVLYAKWIALSNYGTSAENVISINGKEETLSTLDGEKVYVFTALDSALYKLKVKNTADTQTTVIKWENKNKESKAFEVIGAETKIESLLVHEGEVYHITISAKNGSVGNTTIISLCGTELKAEGRRDSLLPYGGEATAIAVVDNSERDSGIGYSFAGWYTSDNKLITSVKVVNSIGNKKYNIYPTIAEIEYEDYYKYANSDGIIELYAKWNKYSIEIISSDLDGGNTGVDFTIVEGDSEYDENVGARVWNLGAVARSGYSFNGWYLYDKANERFEDVPFATTETNQFILYDGNEEMIVKCEWLYNTESGKFAITYTMNTADAVNSPYNVSGFTSQSTSTILLYDPHKYYRNSKNEIIGYYLFEGWFIDREYNNRISQINPKEYNSNINIYAKWGDPISFVDLIKDANGDMYFYMGIYPQTKVISQAEKDSLRYDNAVYDGNDYRNLYRYYSESSGTRYFKQEISNSEEYYRCEPIRWTIRKTNDGIVYAESDLVLDIIRYNLSANNSGEYYANNWEKSKIRAWLSNNFFKIHFSQIEQNLLCKVDGIISNKENTGNSSYSDVERYAWAKQNNTKDYIFASSYSEKTDSSFGYSDNSTRIPVYSDYARDKALACGVTGYWLRSWGDRAYKAYIVTAGGALSQRSVDEQSGVRPVLYLNTHYCDNE